MSRSGMIKELMSYGINEHYNMVDNRDNNQTEAEQLNDELNVLRSMNDNELKELFNAFIE